MKRHYYFKKSFLGIIGILIFSAVTAYGAEESITLTTYYPSPYGVYSEMRLYPKPDSTTPCVNGNPNSQPGVMFYDSNNNQLKVCVQTGPNAYSWQLMGGGFWTQAGSSLYPTNNSWNVGIGTTSPSTKLTIDFGNEIAVANANGIALIGNNNPGIIAARGAQELFTIGGVTSAEAYTSGSLLGDATFTSGSGRILFGTGTPGSTTRMAITNSGNVGIGTTNPQETLHVNGDIYAGGNFFKSGDLTVANTAISAWSAEGGVIAGFRNGNAVAIGQSGAGAYPGLGITSGSSPLASFYSGNGEVGIASYAGGPNVIRMYKEFPRGWSAVDIMLVRDGTIHLRNQNGIDRLFVASSGLVGIGTTNPAVKLHVVGDMGCQFPGSGVYGDYFYVNQESGRPVARIFDDGSYNPVLQFGKGNSWMNLEYTGSTLNIGGNTGSNVSAYDYWIGALSKWASSFSDIRLKENIQPITDVLERIQAIKCVSFNWNEAYAALGHPNDKRQIGVIAQDVEQSFPELVISSEERGYKSVNYDGVTAVLLEAIKEQQAEIESLEARIETLEKR